LDLLVGGGAGVPEKLFLIDRPTADGRVRLQSWSSDDWSAAPTSSECNATGLLAEIESAVREGHSLNREMSVVRHWLAPGP
jgi:hypothetical protein